MYSIAIVQDEQQRRTVKRLFAEYQRGVELMLDGTDVCP